MPAYEPEVVTYYRPGDFYYRPEVVIETLRGNGTVSQFHVEE